MSSFLFNRGTQGLLDRSIDWDNDTIAILALGDTTPWVADRDATNLTTIALSELTGVYGYTPGFGNSGRKVLANRAIATVGNVQQLKADDPSVWTLAASSVKVTGWIVYKRGASDAASVPIIFLDWPDIATNGSTMKPSFPGSVIAQLNTKNQVVLYRDFVQANNSTIHITTPAATGQVAIDENNINLPNTFAVVANMMTFPGGARFADDAGSPDVRARWVIRQVGTSCYCLARHNGDMVTTIGLVLTLSATTWDLAEYDATQAPTYNDSLGSGAYTPAADDVWEVDCNADTVVVRLNGVVKLTVTTTFARGQTYVGFAPGDLTNNKLASVVAVLN